MDLPVLGLNGCIMEEFHIPESVECEDGGRG